MYNETACVPTCDYSNKDGRVPLNELLKKLDDLSNQNLELTISIGENLFGPKPENDCSVTKPVDCMENAIKSVLENTYRVNNLLTAIRERL